MNNADTILKRLLTKQAEYPTATEVHQKTIKSVQAVIPIWLGQEQLWGKLTSEEKGYKGYTIFCQEQTRRVLHAYCYLDVLKHIPKEQQYIS